MAGRRITIEIDHDASGVAFDSFLSVVRHTVKMLRGVDRIINASDVPTCEWLIADASMNSPLHMILEAVPQTKAPIRDPIEPFVRDVNRLEEGRPAKVFTPSLEREAKAMVAVYNNGVTGIRYTSDDLEARPSQDIAQYVERHILEVQRPYFEVGSIEGRLDVISVHGSESAKVWDARFNMPVECRLSGSQLRDSKDLLGKRVSVRGRIRYQSRLPRSVSKVYDIRELKGTKDRIGPIDLTGGIDPLDFLRGDDDAD